MPKCHGITAKKTPCTRNATDGTDYCKSHAAQDYSRFEVPAIPTGPPTPPPESPKKAVAPAEETSSPLTTVETKPRTRAASKTKPDNISPYARPPLVRVAPPSDARHPGATKTKCPADVGAVYAPMHTKHAAIGINGTSSDAVAYKGGWLGMLRDLATTEVASSRGFDFKALAAMHAGLTTCCVDGCSHAAEVGAHVWIWRSSGRKPGYDLSRAYRVPTCTFPNSREFDHGKQFFDLEAGTPAMQMLPRSDYQDYIQKQCK